MKRHLLKKDKKDSDNYYILESTEKPISSRKKQILKEVISFCVLFTRSFVNFLKRKYKEEITLMFIPHNGKKLKNYHISNLVLSMFLFFFLGIIVISSIYIIRHNSTIQEVDKLKISKEDTKLQFDKVKLEIQNINSYFENIKQNISKLYNLIHSKPSQNNFLYAEGGETSTNLLKPPDINNSNTSNLNVQNEIALEIFMLNNIIDNMKISEVPLNEIKNFINKKKVQKMLHHTPTLWPVYGHILHPYGFVRSHTNLNVYFSNGIDIGANPGNKVVTTAPGVIKSIKRLENNLIEIQIQHHYSYKTSYRGLEGVTIKEGSSIAKGDTIGYLGLHPKYLMGVLHYQIFIGTEHQNPITYLSYTPNL